MKRILVLHGPNLNLLGQREVDIYGSQTLTQINATLIAQANTASIQLDCFQSNYEGALIDKTHEALTGYDFLIINPACLTHTSIGWYEAVIAVNKPFIEVHLSNIQAREPFRHHSYFAKIAQGTICGLGIKSYTLALTYAIEYLLTNITTTS